MLTAEISNVNDTIAYKAINEDNALFITSLVIILLIALIVAGRLFYKIYISGDAPKKITRPPRRWLIQEPTQVLTNNKDKTRQPKHKPSNKTETPRKTSELRGAPKTNIVRETQQRRNTTTSSIAVKSNSDSTKIARPDDINRINNTPTSTPASITPAPAKVDPFQQYRIGYIPVNKYEQLAPYSFPYVAMPKPNSITKPPRQGKTGRKGYTEDRFKTYLQKYFGKDFLINNDQFLLVKGQIKPFEPDFSLMDTKSLNMFIDIEIDEPYEGINNLESRQPTHYQGDDSDRNRAFVDRGWIVIRFAEIQVHQSPDACCRYISEVLKYIYPEYDIPNSLQDIGELQPIKQWTRQEAMAWSKAKYREQYLGINSFGTTIELQPSSQVIETELGSDIEDLLGQENANTTELYEQQGSSYNYVQDLIKNALYEEAYLLITYYGYPTIIKPFKVRENELRAYCFIKNRERSFSINNIKSISLRSRQYKERFSKPTKEQIRNIFNTARNLNQLLRIKYVRDELDKDTGELIDKEAKYYTISNMKVVQDGIRKIGAKEIRVSRVNHFDATYHDTNDPISLGGKTITLRFDKIRELEVLDLTDYER